MPYLLLVGVCDVGKRRAAEVVDDDGGVRVRGDERGRLAELRRVELHVEREPDLLEQPVPDRAPVFRVFRPMVKIK